MANSIEWVSQTGNLPDGVPHPTRSLGYQILRWAEKYIVQPDGENAGKSWQFTNEQKRFILWMYAIDEKGRWLYQNISLRRSKGWGKTPLLAALAIIEFIGPARFGGFDGRGRPVGVSVRLPLVQIAAVSLEQTANTRDMIRGMLSESPAEAEYGLEIGKERIQFLGGKPGRIEPVAASSRGLEGARPTFVLGDETHHWVPNNGGIQVAEVLQRNVDKTMRSGSRLAQTTNAFNPNEDSVAQRTFDAFKNGANKLLYDCVEGPPVEDLKNSASVLEALEAAYGDSYWAPVEGLVDKATDPLTPNAVFYRFYLNQIAESADNWIPGPSWLALAETDDNPIQPGDMITIGFDGSLYYDSTAIIGCRVSDGKLFVIGLWERPDHLKRTDHWEVPIFEVDKTMREAFETYKVAFMYADPSYWQNTVGTWHVDYPYYADKKKDTVHEFSPQRLKQMAEALERFETAVLIKDTIKHDGDERLTRHILNAVTYVVPQGTLIRKESRASKKKIDAAISAVLAYEARAEAIADGRNIVKRKARMYTF